MSAWNQIHQHYANQDWSKIPSLFSWEALDFFPTSGKILEIGAWLGQDSRFFHSHGYDIYSTDFSSQVVELNEQLSISEISSGHYRAQVLDVSRDLSFLDDEIYDVIYTHLSLHYFSQSETQDILWELHRILKKWWIIAVLLNSIKDPEYHSGLMLEKDYFLIRGIKKRFFIEKSAHLLFDPFFSSLLCDNQGETYKDSEKWIHNLIRYIWQKV